jgi:hypothetical protein
MSTPDRRSARNQALPAEEVAILRSLKGFNLYARVLEIYTAGWTLRAIGEAFDPPKARSTVKSWAEKAENSKITVVLPPVEAPTLITPAVYVPVRPISPGISTSDLTKIQDLAPISRKYRSGMSPLHRAALANQGLTDTCLALYDTGVSIRELSEAAGVTYRAMAKRLGRA